MTTYYTNNPSRFGGCYATHDPTVSQVTVQPPVIQTQQTGGGGGILRHWTPVPASSRRKRLLDDVNIVIKPDPAKAAKELDKILSDAVLQQQEAESARLAIAIEDARNAEIKRLIELDLAINEDEAFILILAQSV